MLLNYRIVADGNYCFDGDSSSSEEERPEPHKKKKRKPVTRSAWTKEELGELKLYFKDFVHGRETPSRKTVQRIKKTMKKGAALLGRRDDLVVKKLSAMKMKKVYTKE